MGLSQKAAALGLCGMLLPLLTSLYGQSFTFDLAANTAKITLARPADGLIPLRLIYKPATGAASSLQINARVNAPTLTADGSNGAQKVQATLVGTGSCDKKPASGAVSLAVQNNWEPLCLFVNKLDPGKFTGMFLITGMSLDPTTKASTNLGVSQIQLEISEVPPGALIATAISVTPLSPSPVSVTLPLFGFQSGKAALDVALQEKGGKADVVDVIAHMDSPAGIDSSKIDASWDDDTDVGNLFASDPDRKITAGQQDRVRLALHDLTAGDYNLTFKFGGMNATAEDTQKVSFVVHVRHHWLWPALVILGATIISFLANKVISAKRRSAALMEKIGGLRAGWLDDFAETPPVVWVRAMLSQAETLSSRYWLTSPDTIEARVNTVANVLKVLDDARRLRDRLHDALDLLVFRRVVQSLERLVARVGAGAIDDQTAGKFETQLTPFEDYLNKDRFGATLWDQIKPEIQRLQAEIAAHQLEAPDLPVFTAANDTLTAAIAEPPTTTAAANTAYRNYVILSAIWNCRHNGAALAQCAQAGGDVLQLFDILDQEDWQKVLAANLHIQFPGNQDPDGIEAFSPLTFSITADGGPAERTYVFRHNMSVNWTIEFAPKKRRFRRTLQPITLTPRTLGPSVMQYFPTGGTVRRVSAELFYRGTSHPLPSDETLEIAPSREFRVMNGFEKAELMGWAIATAIAIASGISIYYLPAAGWGSFKDYMTLFLWGAVGDAGRNFVQASTGIPK